MTEFTENPIALARCLCIDHDRVDIHIFQIRASRRAVAICAIIVALCFLFSLIFIADIVTGISVASFCSVFSAAMILPGQN